MAQYQNNHSHSEVSVLRKALELLMKTLKTIARYLGIVFVDKGMRSLVRWYDRRHQHSNGHKDSQSGGKTNDFKAEIARLKQHYKILETQLADGKKHCTELETEVTASNSAKDHLQQELSHLQEQVRQLKADNDTLTERNNSLVRRCLPESEVPSMIYYAEGDAAAMSLRKSSATDSSDKIYKLRTFQGDSHKAEFVPLVKQNIKEVIAYRHSYLTACEITGIAAHPTSIEVEEPGEAVFDQNKWKVIKKAKIKLI